MQNILKVDGINVYYGAIHAIKDVSFEVHEGEIVTLIGANGAGTVSYTHLQNSYLSLLSLRPAGLPSA